MDRRTYVESLGFGRIGFEIRSLTDNLEILEERKECLVEARNVLGNLRDSRGTWFVEEWFYAPQFVTVFHEGGPSWTDGGVLFPGRNILTHQQIYHDNEHLVLSSAIDDDISNFAPEYRGTKKQITGGSDIICISDEPGIYVEGNPLIVTVGSSGQGAGRTINVLTIDPNELSIRYFSPKTLGMAPERISETPTYFRADGAGLL